MSMYIKESGARLSENRLFPSLGLSSACQRWCYPNLLLFDAGILEQEGTMYAISVNSSILQVRKWTGRI